MPTPLPVEGGLSADSRTRSVLTPVPTSRLDAQRRVDDIEAFGRELATLAREGVLELSGAQRAGIDAHHARLVGLLATDFDVDAGVRAKQLTRGMRVASLLGALTLAASVYFLYRQYWGLIPTSLQVALLIGATLVTFGATAALQSADGSGYFTKLAAMVAFACFVLNIDMIGAIFNVTPTDNAMLPWAAYAFVLAYTCNLRLLLGAGIICIGTFIAARAGEFGGLYWLDFGERPENFFPAAIVIFAIPRLIRQDRFDGFAPVYRVFGLLGLFLPMLVLSEYGRASYLDLDRATIEHAYQVLGFLASAGGVWLGVRSGWPDSVTACVAVFVAFLCTKFYDWWWEAVPKSVFFLLLGLTALLALFVLRRLRSGGAPTVPGTLA